ncbi:MAG: hypothetical protein ACRCUM_00410 [Mycoplasmoidaceae bacterium]
MFKITYKWYRTKISNIMVYLFICLRLHINDTAPKYCTKDINSNWCLRLHINDTAPKYW